jgi:Icc-related predicted phosphoesterase
VPLRRLCPTEPVGVLALSDDVSELLYSPQITTLEPKVRLVLSCGDLPLEYLEFVVSMLNVPLYYVMGNHDGRGYWRSDGTHARFPQGCVHLEGRCVTDSGLLIAGLGGSIRYGPQVVYQFSEGEMWRRVLRLALHLWGNRLTYGRALDILITHSAPRGINDGPDAAHRGFASLLWLLRVARPRWHLHGHTTTVYGRPAPSTRYESSQVFFIPPYRLLEWES